MESTANLNVEEILKKLRESSIENRILFLKESNITKTKICDQLINGETFKKIPMKSMIIKLIGDMNEEDFLKFVATNIDKVPNGLICSLLKKTNKE